MPIPGRGLAVVQSTPIAAVSSWLRNQPAEVVSAAIASRREVLAVHLDGASVHLPGASGWSAVHLPKRAPPPN